MSSGTTYSTAQAAAEIGVSKQTLLRWFREERIADVTRDRNGWRVFRKSDIQNIIEAVEHAKTS